MRRFSSAEEQIVLLSAGTAARRRAMTPRAQELESALSWSRLAELLGTTRMLPTLGPRILEFASGRASEAFKIGVSDALETTRRQDAFLQLISTRVMGALADAGICSTALKGPFLGEALYGEPGRRPSSDIDLLVPREQLYEAVDVVRELGYAPPADYIEARGLPWLHFALVHERKELPPVELHWRINWYESQFARNRLLESSDDSSGWRPAPVDDLIALLLFYARDGFIGLRYATDLGAWWDAFGATLRPGALDESIQAYPALQRPLLAAALVAERTVGLPAGQITKRVTKLGARGRVAVWLGNPFPHTSEAQIYADMGLIDGLLTPFGGLRAFIRRQVVPPRDMTRLQGRDSTLGHSGRMLGRYALAMARLLWTRMSVATCSGPGVDT